MGDSLLVGGALQDEEDRGGEEGGGEGGEGAAEMKKEFPEDLINDILSRLPIGGGLADSAASANHGALSSQIPPSSCEINLWILVFKS
ncbi:unnamed protein product [Linum trigynum]|uniref:Uncharacterized protein n=1 Tax=Linum trigynum TaxID=586398 RepID=A0AAV2G5G1_9ROSI